MLHASSLPKSLWGEAMMHATWLKNRSSTRRLGNKTPYEVLYNKKPDLQKLPVWGCQVKVHDVTGSKLDMRARDGHWVGFDLKLDGHCIYCADRGTVGVERSVVFERRLDVTISTSVSAQPEGEKRNSPDGSNGKSNADSADASTSSNEPVHEVSQRTTPVEDLPSHLGDGFKPQPPEPVLRRSTCQRFESEYFKRLKAGEGTADRWTTHLIETAKAAIEELFNGTTRTGKCPDDNDVVFAMVAGIAEVEALNPSTVDEVRSRPDWEKWETAIAAELRSLDDAQTWRVVEWPIGVNVVGCKWVFKIKRNAVGEIDKYKARLVVKGYSQVQGIDYDDTYTPITQLSSLHTILAIAARNNWDIEVFDFHLAFLNGKLDQDEDIYMELPPGYKTDRKYKRPVAKLLVALYGSKQGALKWYLKLCRTLRALKLTRAESDWGVFYLHIGHDILILASHVNDCTLTGSSPSLIKVFKKEIKAQYKISDLRPINWLLGMKVTHHRDARTIETHAPSRCTHHCALTNHVHRRYTHKVQLLRPQAVVHPYGPEHPTLAQPSPQLTYRSCTDEAHPISGCGRFPHAPCSGNPT